jgi:hypothetical protein
MGRLAALALAILAIGAGVHVLREGPGRAFGGRLAGLAARFQAPAERESPDRPLDAFQRAWNRSEDRVDHLLEQPAARE